MLDGPLGPGRSELGLAVGSAHADDPHPGAPRRLNTDDGTRLWLNGKLLIDQWKAGPGPHMVEVEPVQN